MNIYPVILSGGSGSRLWPLSRQALPKQLLPLVSSQTLLQETVLRVRDLCDVGLAVMPPLLLCGNEHRFMVAEQLRQVGVASLAILLEPLGRNTAPAVAAAAQYLLAHDADALMLVLPADHLVGDVAAFHRAIAAATANHLLMAILGMLSMVRDRAPWQRQHGRAFGHGPQWEYSLRQGDLHLSLVDAIAAGDPARAHAVMREHLSEIAQLMSARPA